MQAIHLSGILFGTFAAFSFPLRLCFLPKPNKNEAVRPRFALLGMPMTMNPSVHKSFLCFRIILPIPAAVFVLSLSSRVQVETVAADDVADTTFCCHTLSVGDGQAPRPLALNPVARKKLGWYLKNAQRSFPSSGPLNFVRTGVVDTTLSTQPFANQLSRVSRILEEYRTHSFPAIIPGLDPSLGDSS